MNRICLAAAALLLAGPASAGDFTPVPGLGSTVLDLDTNGGSYSAWVIDDLSGINAIRTTLQVHRLGSDPKWGPVFKIMVSSAKRHAALEILGKQGMPQLLVLLAQADKGQDEDMKPFPDRLELDKPLEVAIDWTPDGTVTVQAAGQSMTASLGGPATQLQFSDSTGEVEFNPLKIGKTGP